MNIFDQFLKYFYVLFIIKGNITFEYLKLSFSLSVAFFCRPGTLCIKLNDISVPNSVKLGSDVKLVCDYNLEGDSLYSLKWHFNNNEFYRFVPRDSPPKQIFPLNFIELDLNASYNGTTWLRKVNFSASGKYKCEISAEGSFQTVFKEKIMLVTGMLK
ncbi:hypothetical protein B4U79_09317 [Dinothrombium tinctorium]|uniref:Ig-like domain-containing protein n=1 Tax=Dinothrombium tinctorium TaxID=1965070 RepID=A0A443RA02_9ACAR|nr:hypothetical protein B4U79_09317 [Dinothrombium tinctorium]